MNKIIITAMCLWFCQIVLTVNATKPTDTLRDNLWQSFLNPPDSIRVGCYYYWVNERVDPKGMKAKGYPVEDIAEITGLTAEEIEAL